MSALNPLPSESRRPRTVWYSDAEWDALAAQARNRSLSTSPFVRMLSMWALSLLSSPAVLEASPKMRIEALPRKPLARRAAR